MLRRLCSGIAVAGFALACGEEPGQADAVWVRLRNDTPFNFDSLAFVTQDREFGPLPAGAFSAFQTVVDIYSFESAYGEVGELRFYGMIFDHLGDEHLGVGYHTFDVFADVDHPEYYLSGFSGAVYLAQSY